MRRSRSLVSCGHKRDLAFGNGCFRNSRPDNSPSFVIWKGLTEHGSTAFRLLFSGLILNDVPMLDKDSVFNAHNVGGNPIHREAEGRKSPVHNHEVSLCHDRSGFVLQRWRKALD